MGNGVHVSEWAFNKTDDCNSHTNNCPFIT